MEAAEIEPERTKRVVFHEITAPAVAEAFSHPRNIDMNLVNAQQARRVLDRLVGYSISPILWEKVRGRLSAGRVQSVALRLIVDREREIEDFKPVEYWSIHAEFKPEKLKSNFIAKLVRVDDKEPELPNEETVKPLLWTWKLPRIPLQRSNAESGDGNPLRRSRRPRFSRRLRANLALQQGAPWRSRRDCTKVRMWARRHDWSHHLHANRLDECFCAGAN
jgi:hypothetical protein